MVHLQAHDLVFLIPMALVGLLAMGAIPVAAKALRISCRCAGAIIGVLLGVLVLEALPLLIYRGKAESRRLFERRRRGCR